MITLWEFQHSTHTAAQPGDRHTTTNYWLCSHHESLSYEQECPSSFPYSSSPPATPLFLRILQTVLPYTWVRPQQPPLPSFRPGRHCSEPVLKHRHSSPATQKADPRERLQLSWALSCECEGLGLPETPSHWSARSSGFSRAHKDTLAARAQKEPPNLQRKKKWVLFT